MKSLMFVFQICSIILLSGHILKAEELLERIHPVIVSYYWPVEKIDQGAVQGNREIYNLTMETPNVIDIMDIHSPLEVKKYWMERGKIILHRVTPFYKGIKTEAELYDYFAKNMRAVHGISIDEILSHQLSKSQINILINVLTNLRNKFPEKYIFVWDASKWNARSIPLLLAIRDSCDIFMCEFYVSEKENINKKYNNLKGELKRLEQKVPGILGKTIIGIGVYHKMDNVTEIDFKQHVESQIKYIRSDALLKKLPGLALYAPVYISLETQKYLDGLIKKYYF